LTSASRFHASYLQAKVFATLVSPTAPVRTSFKRQLAALALSAARIGTKRGLLTALRLGERVVRVSVARPQVFPKR
jgi:hypothetical protein